MTSKSSGKISNMAFLNKYEKNGHIKLKRQRKTYQLWHILKIFHSNQYNRCKTYTRCEKGSGVDQFYIKGIYPIDICKKRLQQLEKVAEEIKFRCEAKRLKKDTTGWKMQWNKYI